MSAIRSVVVIWSCILPAWCAGGAGPASAATTTGPAAQKVRLTLNVVTEEQRKQLQATVTLAAADKPVENVTVAFAVKRTFGDLVLGLDKTLDDGTAAVLFPSDLPGGLTGQIRVAASVTAPPEYAGARVEVILPAGRAAPDTSQAFPRALWAPRAPVLLIVIIFLILGAVWFCYAYVVVQVVAILRKR
jgi:hypothetical protein